MKGLLFVLTAVVVLAIFGLPVLGCFMVLLAIGLGVAVETSMTVGMFLTVAMVVGIAIQVWFFND